jgi:hypothetical protein
MYYYAFLCDELKILSSTPTHQNLSQCPCVCVCVRARARVCVEIFKLKIHVPVIAWVYSFE